MIDIFSEFVRNFQWQAVLIKLVHILLILILGFISSKIVFILVKRFEQRLIHRSAEENEPPSESQKRIETLTRLAKQGTILALWIVLGLTILDQIGVQIGPILASAGIIGVAVGFGAQNLVRDVISGFFITLEGQIRVGDVAVINGTGGLVEKINFRTTILRDLNGTVHVFPNGSITTLGNLTKEWSAYVFEIGVAYKENTDHVISIIKEAANKLQEDQEYQNLIIEPIEIFGVDKLGDSSVVIKGRIKTKPIRQWMVGREFLRRIKLAFDENNIEIPFPHRTLYFGEKSKPVDLRIFEKYLDKTNSVK